MNRTKLKNKNRGRLWPLSIAPMMQWTDRHYRFFMRQITRHTLLYTEMITSGAVLHGNREKLLGFSPEEKPLALQIGGDNPEELAGCAQIVEEWGYDEIDLNGYVIKPGKTYPPIINSIEELEALNPIELFSNGYTNVILNFPGYDEEFSKFPFNIFLNEPNVLEEKIKVESVPNFIIRKDGIVKYAVVNGFLRDLEKPGKSTSIGNSLILK